MAALIHHHHYSATNSTAAFSPSCRHILKPSSYLSPSKTPLSLPFSKPHLFSKTPSFQHLLNSKSLEVPQKPDFTHLLKLSIQYSDSELNKVVHASILKSEEDTRFFNSLISSYLKLGHLNDARKVFNSTFDPDVVSYTAMITGLAKSNCEKEAVELFFEMRGSGIEPNEFTFVALLTACVHLLNVDLGSQIHAFSVKTGYFDCTYVSNALMGLYGKCGCLDFVVQLFDEMPNRSIASWNTVISCVVKEGMYDKAFELFRDVLILDEDRVDYFTLSSLLVACARSFAIREGRAIHAYAHKIGYTGNLSVNNALIEFYSRCCCLKNVETLFDRMRARDVFTWTEMINAYMGFGLVDMALEIFDRMPERNCVSYNTLLSGYCQNSEGFKALKLFCRMLEEGMELNDFTLTSAINACGLTMDLKISEQIHAFVLKFGFGSNEHIESALLDMCTRSGRINEAEKILHRLPQDKINSFMFTSILCGFARTAELDKAISLICRWQYEKAHLLDEVALASILGICGDLGFQNLGEQFHCQALKYGFLGEIGVGNATLSMYSKCGKMEQAIRVFDGMFEYDIVSWNCLLAAHILHRQGDSALNVWKKMQKLGILPDTITCFLIISAYKHTDTNLVEQCQNFFQSMSSLYQVEPNSDHYACLVSVLGFWDLLEEAEETIDNMPFEPKASVWKALLHSCRIHLNHIIGRKAAMKILSIKVQDPSTYILKSNLYSASGRWQCSELVRQEMKEKGVRKFPSRSWIIHENKVHSFFARDKSHSQSKDICSALQILNLECLKAGYVPDTSFVLHEVEELQKPDFLLYHSGKLAVTYGLITTRHGKPVKVNKNINLCGDCHTFLKYISNITRREIHVRDASGFHCFANGECSCRDYW